MTTQITEGSGGAEVPLYRARKENVVSPCIPHGDFEQETANPLQGKGSKRKRDKLDEFLSTAREVWGTRWDYSKTQYVKSSQAVTITCRDHGDFKQTPKGHKNKYVGCKSCQKYKPVSEKEFFTRSKRFWGDRWDYSLVSYSNVTSPVVIRCIEHDVSFRQVPHKHYSGELKCLPCRRGTSQREFLIRAKEVWGDRWDYSEVAYTNSRGNVEIICPLHGKFMQLANSHIRGYSGCAPCNRENKSIKGEDFIHRSNQVWGGRWDYSETKYVGMDSKIRIDCKEHGRFTQTAQKHLLGRQVGCPSCHGKVGSLSRFIEESQKVWGSRWDYSKSHYSNNSTPLEIGCFQHGSFWQVPTSHWAGNVGCHPCRSKVWNLDSFVAKSEEAWGDRWGYSQSLYSGYQNHIEVLCVTHGTFSQMAESHLKGFLGCRECHTRGTSRGEKDIFAFIQAMEGVDSLGRVKGELSNPRIELDIYVPEKKVAIEFNGVYWHSSKFKDKGAHHTKFKMAEEAGIKLVQVWEDDWNLRRPIVEEHLKQVLGVSTLPKIAARKTKVVEVPYSVAKDFLNANHIQGAAGAAFHLSLQYEGDVVALASFKRRSDGGLELVRYATSANVQGGHSKLVTYVERNYTYNQLVTFADLTFGSGELYRKTGWVEDKFLSPDYQYLVGGRRVHKFNYRLKRFREDPDLQYVEGMSESQLSELNGLLRVYDAGKIRFVKKHPNDDTT